MRGFITVQVCAEGNKRHSGITEGRQDTRRDRRGPQGYAEASCSSEIPEATRSHVSRVVAGENRTLGFSRVLHSHNNAGALLD